MIAFSKRISLAPTEVLDAVQAQLSHVKPKHGVCKAILALTISLFMQPIIAISAKAAATMVSWLHLKEDGHASLAVLATNKVDPPDANSWEHLVMVMCKAQQASGALAALQPLSYMSTLPSRAVAEVFKVLVNLVGGSSAETLAMHLPAAVTVRLA